MDHSYCRIQKKALLGRGSFPSLSPAPPASPPRISSKLPWSPCINVPSPLDTSFTHSLSTSPEFLFIFAFSSHLGRHMGLQAWVKVLAGTLLLLLPAQGRNSSPANFARSSLISKHHQVTSLTAPSQEKYQQQTLGHLHPFIASHTFPRHPSSRHTPAFSTLSPVTHPPTQTSTIPRYTTSFSVGLSLTPSKNNFAVAGKAHLVQRYQL